MWQIAVMVMLLILPVCDLVTTVCCGEGGRRTGTGSDISGEEGTGGPQVRPSDSLSFPHVHFELIISHTFILNSSQFTVLMRRSCSLSIAPTTAAPSEPKMQVIARMAKPRSRGPSASREKKACVVQ